MSLLLPLLFACAGSEYGLAPQGGLVPPELEPTDDLGEGAAFAAWEAPAVDAPVIVRSGRSVVEEGPSRAQPSPDSAPSAPRWRSEAVALGPTPIPVADYLLVIDESISMGKIMERFDAGIASLTRPGVFPAGSRIAVLHTTPADPADASRPHPAVKAHAFDGAEPGFGALVDGARIVAFRKAAPRYADRYALDGCDAWFAPDDVNDQGVSCLRAHAQVPLLPGRAEAGLVALRQWLESTAGTPRFRAGAAVNVLFLSDTHDPGLSPRRLADLGAEAEALVAERPDLSELEGLVDEPVAAFRVHAIAPREECGEKWDEPTYFDVAADAGGVAVDSCTTDDYAAVVEEIAKAGSIRQHPVVRLGYPAGSIVSVKVDGTPVAWRPTDDPQAIVLEGVLPSSVKRAVVTYLTE